jgi:hypothetical protein
MSSHPDLRVQRRHLSACTERFFDVGIVKELLKRLISSLNLPHLTSIVHRKVAIAALSQVFSSPLGRRQPQNGIVVDVGVDTVSQRSRI